MKSKCACTCKCRRRFLGGLGRASLVCIFWQSFLPFARGSQLVTVPLKRVPRLKTLNDAVLLKFRDRDVLMIRTAEDRVTALDAKCTHKGCQVEYEKEWGEIRCDCHGSVYSTSGEVLESPAKRDLHQYPTMLAEDHILLDLTGKRP